MRRSRVYSHLSHPEAPIHVPSVVGVAGADLTVSGELRDLRTDAQSQQAEYGVGEATPYPQVLEGLVDEVGSLGLRRGLHRRALVLDIGWRRGHDDVE